ncbi:MAG: TetR/AcrR family transcriptional regulator [Lachnospiraceae bacterium]|nr:TetR/AcrR family transcriptional regulator [Lachnospiraceae bacterium]MCR5405435.1 TetR/AcrR family transcriptional regulator [Lachnospiraceae bacterium]MCR5405445.1 TetR/AcrR family transcriptional regulator [Lachnospiraceae bacterium]
MARKESITKQMIIDGAFELLKKEGVEAVTARKLAAHIGCSTQPIFRVYENMDELLKELFERSRAYYEDFCNSNKNSYDTPFVSLGINYIRFAKQEQNLFKLLFLSGNKDHTLYELINGKENAFVMKEIKKIPNLNMDNVELIFTKVFIFMHGMAGMTITGEFDLSDKEAEDMLKDAIKGFIG